MVVYPYALDSDTELPRVDDRLTELGSMAIDSLRDAVFALEEALGINPAGSLLSTADRLNISLNSDGTIKASALTSIGLVTLPIDNAQIGAGAGILESKLTLYYPTDDLFALISNNSALITALTVFTNSIDADLLAHIGGAATLPSTGNSARHCASHLDLNAVPNDPRDPAYVWAGLLDKTGAPRSATTVAQALDEINTDLTTHENAIADAHVATAVSVDTDAFVEIPTSANTVQLALNAIDSFEVNSIGEHRAVQHANCVPPIARSFDASLSVGAYGENVCPSTTCTTYLAHPLNTLPHDTGLHGDDVIAFFPANVGKVFDSQFCKVKPGDIITVNYGNGVIASFPIESTQFAVSGSWRVRINGYNLYDSHVASAKIDRPRFDTNTAGVLAVAAANASPNTFGLLTGVIVGNPRGATALGLGFDANQIGPLHYKLYLELYPTGIPSDKIISLPFIDVTGNAGATPGAYTLDGIVQTTNNAFRQIGYNYRFIAFNHHGEFGIMLADCISNASFAVIAGTNILGALTTGIYTENVIGGSTVDTFDALGFGTAHANISGPTYQVSYVNASAALLPAIVITPRKSRNYLVNGRRWDQFAESYNTTAGGYWDAYIFDRVSTGSSIETTYTIPLDLKAAGLKIGKTLVVQPAITFSDPLYNDVDYGRFIIKEVNYIPACFPVAECCQITVISGIHATGDPLSLSGVPSLPVRLYFSEDSVSFNNINMISGALVVSPAKRFHEIFITDTGKTFSHERARFAFQAGAGTALDTNCWHVRSVSPNLRGYRDLVTDVAKYVRFYILTYNTTTGEYAGYIGKRVVGTDNIDNVGPVTIGRKNVVTRFYDETYTDYIDLVYKEISTTATPIIPPATPRWVDIEVFSSLQTNDELLSLATCEVNWGLTAGHDIVEEVIDVRQFGSIAETDFTESALSFISAGDRYLHENGIIRGLSFDYINATDNFEIFFKGGVALVNGNILSVNNISVTIPQVSVDVSPDDPFWPTVTTWAVCVNELGVLVPIVLSYSKDQFFANAMLAGTKYYIPSVTFAELINTRKDLTPIAIVYAAIISTVFTDPISMVSTIVASATITNGDVNDVRRFIAQEGAIHPLTLSSGYSGAEIGNFNTFDALLEWVKNYCASAIRLGDLHVKLRGEINVSSAVDLTNLLVNSVHLPGNGALIFEGDNAVINVTSASGFLVGNDYNIAQFNTKVTFKNITFTYDPDPSLGIVYNAGDKTVIGNACIYKHPSFNLQDLTIEKCKFYSTLAARPSFVSLEMDNDKYIDGIIIRDCVFEDISAVIYSAITLYSSCAVGVATSPATATNVLIENNICNQYQGIYIASPKIGTAFVSPGIYANNVRIVGNKCGAIGYMVSSIASAQVIRGPRNIPGLIIADNNCRIIASTDSWGSVARVSSILAADYTYASGNVEIRGNHCSWIQVTANDFPGQAYASILISENILKADDSAALQNIYWNTSALYENHAILVNSREYASGFGSVGIDVGSCIIDKNVIENSEFGDAYVYGIKCDASAVISKNSIKGFTTYGICVKQIANSPTCSWTITENKIYRGTTDITAYIYDWQYTVTVGFPSTYAKGKAIVTNNYFDSESCDVGATDYEVVKGTQDLDGWVVTQNTNQRVTVVLGASDGWTYTIDDVNIGGVAPASYVYLINMDTITFKYKNADNLKGFGCAMGLRQNLPNDVEIISVSADITTNVTAGKTTYGATLSLLNRGAGTHNSDPEPDADNLIAGTITLTVPTTDTFYNTESDRLMVILYVRIHDSSDVTVTIDPITVVYRW